MNLPRHLINPKHDDGKCVDTYTSYGEIVHKCEILQPFILDCQRLYTATVHPEDLFSSFQPQTASFVLLVTLLCGLR